jgi:hypothetical protein
MIVPTQKHFVRTQPFALLFLLRYYKQKVYKYKDFLRTFGSKHLFSEKPVGKNTE